MSEYKITILTFLGEEGISSTALTLCMRLLKTEGQHLHNSEEYNFPTKLLTDIVRVLLRPGSGGDTERSSVRSMWRKTTMFDSILWKLSSQVIFSLVFCFIRC